MIAELLGELLQGVLALSAAVVLMVLVRKPLRTLVGAEAVYRCWLAVPAAVLAVWLPGPSIPLTQIVASETIGAVVAAQPASMAASAVEIEFLALVFWLAGTCVFAGSLAVRQIRFSRRIRRQNARPFDLVEDSGPAVVGLWHARVVLPEDFYRRYGPEEQQLILAHEQAHVRRRDLQAHLLASALRCLQWFNPLAHIGAALFRFDQELACDAAVLAQFPSQRRRYGEAMLKTRLADDDLPLACHWQSTHLLKERIAMLKHPLPTPARRTVGALLTLSLLIGGSYAAWAAQPGVAVAAESAPLVDVNLQMSIDGGVPTSPRLVARLGEPFAVAMGEGSSVWRMELTARDEGDGFYTVDGAITRGDRLIGQPRIRVPSGKPVTVDVTTPEGDARFTSVLIISPSAEPLTNAVAPPASMGVVANLGGDGRLQPPEFPAAAKAKRIRSGKVVLALLVGVDGRVKDERVVSAEPAGVSFEEASLKAARRWKVSPAMKDGKPIESWVQIPVQFELQDPDNSTPKDKPASGTSNNSETRSAAGTTPPLTTIRDGDYLSPPKYPADAKSKAIAGKVVLDIHVVGDGSIGEARVVSTEPAGVFEQAAVSAARNWRLPSQADPAKPEGQWLRVPVLFTPDVVPADDKTSAKS